MMSVLEACCVCGASSHSDGGVETAAAPSNVRALGKTRFRVWRCPSCRSIHSGEQVDLDSAYRLYPFHKMKLDGVLRLAYRRLTRRLSQAGLKAGARALDYGCGGGSLVQYLRERGYDAVGYDAFSPRYSDPAPLDARYDLVISQDVVEHVEDPIEMIARLAALCRPGGLVAIGTPNAAAIDLGDADRYVHSLHQPYHRHILALPALQEAGRNSGLEIERTYLDGYMNLPVISLKFLHYYMNCFDGTLDVLFERPLNSARLWLSPETGFYLLFGYWLDDRSEAFVVFRKP